MRDRLYLLKPGFEDPEYPGRRFYCWHCALLEGVLASFPELASRLDVERVAWQRPRESVVARLGPNHQSLPVLVLAEGSPAFAGERRVEGARFIDDKDEILRALAIRHGFPAAHP